MKSDRPRVTSADVAKAAGVSRATVSYVLNEAPGQQISPATRKRVRDAATRLGYQPHAGAAALRRGRSDVVLLVLPAVPLSPSMGGLVETLTSAVTSRGLICVTDIGRRTGDISAARGWLRLAPLAVVVIGVVTTAPARRLLAGAGIHLVEPVGKGPSSMSGSFRAYQAAVGRAQAEYLIARGHTRLGYAASEAPAMAPMAGMRLEGVRAACAGAGLAEPDVLEVPVDAPAAGVAVRPWCGRAGRPTGVAAYNDETALTLIGAFARNGRAVPRDTAVIGVDDIAMASSTTPTLTTVRWPVAWFTKQVADAVDSLVGRVPSQPVAPVGAPVDAPHVVVRESA